MLDVDADVEAKARAIADEAKKTRKQLPRSAWSASLIVGVLCLASLVIGYLVRPSSVVEGPPVHIGGGLSVPEHYTISPFFGTQFIIGVVAGIAIGIAIGSRRRKHD